MRIVSLIDQEDVIERILRHLGLWQEGVRVHCGTDLRAKRPSIRGSTTPSPTTTQNRSWRSRIIVVHLGRSATSEDYARRRPSLHHSQQMLSDPTRMRLSMTTEA